MPPSLYDSLITKLDGRPYSNYFACFCPFDTHKTPAMLVYDDGFFVCLSCGRKGTHAQLSKKVGSHYRPPIQDYTVSRLLPSWRKWERDYGDLPGIVYTAHKSLKRHPQFQTYLKKRKIDDYIDEGVLGFLDGWITFPVFDCRRQIVDIVVRSTSTKSDTRYVVAPSASSDYRPLYCPSWKRVEEAQTVYVVYGIVDSISLHLAGLPVVTGITGKSLNADVLRPLGKRFIILPDDGEEDAAHKLANKLGWRAAVKELDYPDDEHKDPDSVRRDFGNQTLLQLVGA